MFIYELMKAPMEKANEGHPMSLLWQAKECDLLKDWGETQ